MKNFLLKFCIITFAFAALMTSAQADIFYKTKVTGKITHVSLISDTQKIAHFKVDIAFSKAKCRATYQGEEIPCTVTHYPSKDKEGLLVFSYFKVSLNLPSLVKKSCTHDNRCEELLSMLRACHSNCFEITHRKVRVLCLNNRSAKNVLQIDTPSKEEAFHIISRVWWPHRK